MFREAVTIAALVAVSGVVPAQAQDRKVIQAASDLPSVLIELPAKPSELVINGGPGIDRIRDRIKAYAADLLANYEIRDVATQKQIRAMLLMVARSEKRWADVLRLSGELQALEDNPTRKESTGLLVNAYARAALAAGGDSSPKFREVFRSELEKSLAALDWAKSQDVLQSMSAQFQLMSRDRLIGSLQGPLDANAEAQGLKVAPNLALAILGSRLTLTDLLPLQDIVSAALERKVRQGQASAAPKEDRWSPRLVELKPADVKAPVVIGIWDSGFDPSVFGGRLWVNPKEKPNGIDDDGNGFVDDVNGIAFDADYRRSTGALRPMPPAELEGIEDRLKLVKGSLDLQAAVSSPEAAAFRQKMASMKPQEVGPFALETARVSMYLHGTATGYTSSVGNPGARLMHGRFDADLQSLVPRPLDEAAGEALARYARDMVAYFRANKVRVVNMSWRITQPQIAATLASVEPDPERRTARAKAIFEAVNHALEETFRSAPEILFVAGAGNENEDVDFVRSLPAGLNLPNLITVGAVDSTLQPAGFTSYGTSIDVYANGFEVPTRAPGGLALNLSGTSLAAPQVTNLAAKMLAVNPKLTVAQLRSIIEETATAEGTRGLKVINPAAAIARARGS